MLKIGMVLDSFYPSDIRVAKEAEALRNAGHQVYLLCLKRKHEESSESCSDLKVRRIGLATNNFQKGLWDIRLSLNFIHPVFRRELLKFCQEEKIDVIHIHDLPLARTGILVGRKLNIPVVCDFHENYPEGLKTWFKWKKNPLIKIKNRIFFSFRRWKNYEKWVCSNTDFIIAVVDEMKNKLIKEFGVNPAKIKVVTNTESKDFINQESDPHVFENVKQSLKLAYLGNVGPHRGLDTVIRGMKELTDLDIKLLVVGSMKPNVKSVLETIIQEEGVEEMVELYGYRPFEKFYSYMSHATVNLIPHNQNGHTDHTVPHKLFQSMMVGKPVLVSSCKPLKRIVEDSEAGMVFEADNPSDFARVARQLLSDQQIMDRLGNNGREHTLKGELNWETTGKTLTTLYQEFENA